MCCKYYAYNTHCALYQSYEIVIKPPQALLFVGSLNTIAPFVTTFSLLTYAVVNMACLALDLAGAPNFRPTFCYFNKYTSLVSVMFVGDYWFSFNVRTGHDTRIRIS